MLQGELAVWAHEGAHASGGSDLCPGGIPSQTSLYKHDPGVSSLNLSCSLTQAGAGGAQRWRGRSQAPAPGSYPHYSLKPRTEAQDPG